jgi:hypothetical protein
MFDVFYSGVKPNLFAHEREARDIEHARSICGTRYFWWVNYLTDYTGWDFLWEPVPWQKDYTHTWPSQHHEYSGTYLVPRHMDEIQYKFHDRVLPLKSDSSRYTPQTDHADFDWSWHPHPHDPPFIYVFGNQWWPATKMSTVEYHVPGAVDRKFMDQPRATLRPVPNAPWKTLIDCVWDYSWTPDPGDPPYIYVFGNQWHRAEIMPTVEYHVPGAVERKFMRYPLAELLPDDTLWTVPDTVDPADVDFSWVPDPGSPAYIYQFATQHQKTGGPQYCMPGATEIKYVDQLRIRTSRVATAIYEIDHMDGHAGSIPNTTKTVRYFDNYLDILRRLARSIPEEHEFVWICSSICDYTNFDFSWHPEQWQATMMHVFASDDQKFGDTFFMHVPTFLYRSERLQLLDWYDLNFINVSVPRRPMPVIQHNDDTHVSAVQQTEWAGPLAVFANRSVDPVSLPAVSLWRSETKTIVPLDRSAGAVIVPSCAVSEIRTQLYDWPKIDKTHRNTFEAQPQDVVFISYDEPDADRNWETLQARCARAQRVHGVAGMELALEAAANLSTTPWYYAVFAKTRLHEQFDFSFVPDYMQQPKHYIFNALNSTNGLEYGHMGIVLYNCKGIQQINQEGDFGLDYTLSFPHESVPLLSCYGDFATTPYHAWRTAFRETAKLAYFETQQATVEGAYRLNRWLDHAEGVNAEWCLKGAQDGYDFFATTQGDLALLKQSFKWEWLRSYFEQRHGTLQ